MRTRLIAIFAVITMAIVIVVSFPNDPPAKAQQPPPNGPGVPVAPPRPTPPPPLPVLLDRMDVNVAISGVVAQTTVDLTFKNSSDRAQEAIILFPVPAGAAVSDFTMTVDGQTLEGEILGSDEAARIYTSIVQRQRDPALLEYAGQNVLRARVFPVPPRGESRLTLRLTHLLTPENGAVRYRLPLGIGEHAPATISRLTINAHVTSPDGVRSLFSSTHSLRITRESDTAVTASLDQTAAAPRGVFELAALYAGDTLGAGLITYRAAGEDGFFMLWLAPPLRQEARVENDVILILDISGSMAGVKIRQAKAALRYVLSSLGAGDRYNVIAFSSDVDTYATGLRPATAAEEAIRWVDALDASGGTNINDALRAGIDLIDPTRLTTVLFLTDGEPTVGETNAARILENVRTRMPDNARLFVFGVGNDVNTLLLDGLAVQNHGDVSYVLPTENVEEAVSALYGRMSSPQLTNVRIDYGGASVHDVYPQPLPDLFGGQTLFVTGRYRSAGPTTITVSGVTRHGPQSYTFPDLDFVAADRRASYLPRTWASRKIGYLLREIRLRGSAAPRELVDEVRALGLKYGIVTPYTSFLVQEPGTPSATPMPRPVSGAPAVQDASQSGALAAATPAPLRTATAAPGAAPVRPGEERLEITTAGDKTFVRRGGVWVDTEYIDGSETVKVVFLSEEYIKLITDNPELAIYFAAGTRVIVVWNGIAYEVTE